MIRENADTIRESRRRRWRAPVGGHRRPASVRRHAQAPRHAEWCRRKSWRWRVDGARHRGLSSALQSALGSLVAEAAAAQLLAAARLTHDGVTRLHTSHRQRARGGAARRPLPRVVVPGDRPPLRQGGVLAARARAAAAAVVVAQAARGGRRGVRGALGGARAGAQQFRAVRNSCARTAHHRTATRSAAASSAPSAATTRSCAAASPTSPRCSTTTSRRRGRSARRAAAARASGRSGGSRPTRP